MDSLVKSVLGEDVPKRAVLILSGGMDSVTLLHYLKSKDYSVHALSFNYGQKHTKELGFAQFWAAKTCSYFKIIDLTVLKDIATQSSLTSDTPVPEGHYEAENMKSTVVPNRNMVMLSLAIAYAENEGIKEVYIGAHAGDHAIYPDCRPEFLGALCKASMLGTYTGVEILAPFAKMRKRDIAILGKELKVDFANTWSCYKGGEKHCGKCGTCVERQEALEGFDPTAYGTDYETVIKILSRINVVLSSFSIDKS